MKTPHITAALVLAATLLSACNQYTFNREAGDMDNGDFGNATMQNTLLASGQIQPPMGYDKYDAPAAGRLLSGKYAAGVMAKYSGCACGSTPTAAAPAAATTPAPTTPAAN